MSQSISDIFSRSGETVKLPIGENNKGDIKSKDFIQTLGNSEVDTESIINESPKSIPTNQGSRSRSNIAKRYTAQDVGGKLFGSNSHLVGNLIADAYDTITNITEKYITYLPDGNSVLQLYNYISNLGSDGTVHIPPYMSKDDGTLLYNALNIIKDKTIGNLSSDVPRPSWNLIHGLDNVASSKGISGLVGNALKLVGSGYLKDELEKAFYPARISAEDLTNTLVTNFYKQYGADTKSSKGGNWKSTLKTIISDAIKIYSGKFNKNGISAEDALLNKRAFNKSGRLKFDYGELNDPYRSADYELPGETFADIFNNLYNESRDLNNPAYVTSYYDYAGFEIGSNHKWSISLFPYPYSEGEDEYNLFRNSLTPELPTYRLPDIWGKSTRSYNSSIPESSSLISSVLNKVKLHTIKEVEEQVTAYSALNTRDNGTLIDNTPFDVLIHSREFSFNRLPALSFDFNMGTVRTESLKLFNGSSSEIFMGMNYNATLNVSILDDVYNSMFKYFCHYVNSIYDIKTRSVAPYFRCAFEIWITIMQATGSRINHAYKLIGVPIEFTPRLDGQQDPNECRVDVTFGIIGLINPKVDRAINGSTGPDIIGVDKNLNWMDIQLQMK